MAEVNLLRRYPAARRDVVSRHSAQTPENIDLARQYGQAYFDGSRDTGYGGYHYDGRWLPIAEDIIRHFGLRPGDRLLDIGCAKGFLVKDLMTACPGLEAFGLDVSEYALRRCEPEVVGRLHLGDAVRLPFPDSSFDAVVSINTLHNLDRGPLVDALREIGRIGKLAANAYIQVDAYRTPEEKDLFLRWVLTAKTHGTPDGWREIFAEARYQGDFFWTVVD